MLAPLYSHFMLMNNILLHFNMAKIIIREHEKILLINKVSLSTIHLIIYDIMIHVVREAAEAMVELCANV